MARVFVVTAGAAIPTASSGSTSTASGPEIRSGLQWISPVEPVQVEDGRRGILPSSMTAPTGARSGGHACRSVSVAGRCGTPTRATVDDFAIRQEWWTGEALPEATVVRRE